MPIIESTTTHIVFNGSDAKKLSQRIANDVAEIYRHISKDNPNTNLENIKIKTDISAIDCIDSSKHNKP